MYHGVITLTNLVVVALKAVFLGLDLGTSGDGIAFDRQRDGLAPSIDHRYVQVTAMVGTENIQCRVFGSTRNDTASSVTCQQAEHLSRALHSAQVASHRDHALVDGHEELGAVNMVGLLALG